MDSNIHKLQQYEQYNKQHLYLHTFGVLKKPLGSQVTNQPSRQPGTIHLFDKDPRVRTVTVDPKTPIGTKGLSPKAKCP